MKAVYFLMALAGLGHFRPPGAFGQVRDARPEFEVASVKPTPKERLHVPVDTECANGRFRSGGFPVSFMIRFGYQTGDAQILGLPDWARDWDFGYDIDAKSERPVSLDQCRLMVQSLLADRFHMVAHRETREMRGYALMVDEHGPKLQEVTGSSVGQGAQINGQTVADVGVSMSQLASILTEHPAVRMPVIDRTGLAGRYSIHLTFSMRENDGRPSVFTAVREQLGLKLQAGKVPVGVLLVDSMEKAGAN
jgi:uncharacterized protein (TIGR03435 family)